MILWKFAGGTRSIVSGLLMLIGAFAQAKAQVVVDDESAAGFVDTPKTQTVNRDRTRRDIVVKERGMASWYGRSWRGRRTASGTRFDDRAMTAAHSWLPFATQARVTNLQNGRSVEVTVNDRGPYRPGRIIDLSAKAAEVLGIKECGTAEVVVDARLRHDSPGPSSAPPQTVRAKEEPYSPVAAGTGSRQPPF